MSFMKEKAADRMAAAIDVMIHRRSLDARSLAGDARLDYGDVFPIEKATDLVFFGKPAEQIENSSWASHTWAAAVRTLMEVVPQLWGEALALYPWLESAGCQPHEWDNRTTIENAVWMIRLLTP